MQQGLLKKFYRLAYHLHAQKKALQIPSSTKIGKGVVIGQENRGKRKGVPTIGSRVWIGVNAVVGNITVGDDVMIAPNSFVNRDIPSHSIVVGNPCVIHPRAWATEGYIENISSTEANS